MIGTSAPAPLSFATPKGDPGVTHPSVVHVPAGFGGHPYWMALTPYNGSNPGDENPCIYYSDDGDTWQPIPANPIAATPSGGHNSDTHLLLDGNRLICMWREVVNRTYETLRIATSADGATWQHETPAYSGDQFTEHLSPSLIRHGDTWLLYSVQYRTDGPNRVRLHASETISGPWVEQPCSGLADMPAGRDPWHLWIGAFAEGGWHAIITDAPLGASGGSGQLFHSYSLDGHTWAPPTVCIPTLGAWHTALYRACGVWRCGALDVWYSSSAPQWRIGRTRLTPPGGNLSIGILASSAPPPTPPAGGWTDLNLLNSWVNYGSPFANAGYTAPEAVYLRGGVKDGTVTAETVVADNLPAPSGRIIYPYVRSSYLYANISPDSDGSLKVQGTTSSTQASLPAKAYLPSSVSLTAPTLVNGWVNNGNGYEDAGYYKDADGTVYLQGLIKSGSSEAEGILFTLPSGYHPSDRLRVAIASDNSYGAISIYSDGTVRRTVGSTSWLSLTGISFPTATLTAPTLLNSWVNYGSPFANAGYYKDSNGTVHFQGLIKSGNTSTGTTIFTLPVGYRPTSEMHGVVADSTSDGGAIYVTTGGDVKVGRASSTFTFLDGFCFSTVA